MSKFINNVKQLEICDVSREDLRLLSSIKHRVLKTNGFGEINLKLTVKSFKITNAKYTTIDENDNLS